MKKHPEIDYLEEPHHSQALSSGLFILSVLGGSQIL